MPVKSHARLFHVSRRRQQKMHNLRLPTKMRPAWCGIIIYGHILDGYRLDHVSGSTRLAMFQSRVCLPPQLTY